MLLYEQMPSALSSPPFFPPHVVYETTQNGGTPHSPEEMDNEKRYIRNARDLARLVATDTIYT